MAERTGLVAVAAAVFAVAVVAHVGNGAAADARDALDRDDPAPAVALARRAARFQPWSAQPLVLRGEAELALGDVAGARRVLRQAVADDPGDWSAWFSLALATRGAERRRALAQARRLDPLAPELAAVSSAP